MTKTSQQILAEHAARTLPDSLAARSEVLRAILNNITEDHPAYQNIAAQIAGLEVAEKLQRELPFKFFPGDDAEFFVPAAENFSHPSSEEAA